MILYRYSISTTACDAYNDAQNIVENIGNVTNTDADNTLFGKIMSVSIVAHDAYDDMLAYIVRTVHNFEL